MTTPATLHPVRPGLRSTARLPHRRPALAVLATCVLVLGACGSNSDDTATSTTSARPGTTAPGGTAAGPGPVTTGPVTTGPTSTATGLVTPATLPDGSFPSVADPARDGALESVRVKLVRVAEADTPTALVTRPGHPDQMLLAERAGRVRLITRDTDSPKLTIQGGSLVDLTSIVTTDGEMGLLGLAFSPDGNTLYLSYNVANSDSHIDAAPVTDVDGRTRVGRRTTLLRVDQMGTAFHKGGNLVVDADGLLYAGFGDGGPQNDAKRHAQNPDLLLGKILRIDPAHPADGKPYGIPEGNPYATNGKGRPEIYLTGLRNPWRFSFDPTSDDLWIGDVGQDTTEEIDRLPVGPIRAGVNLGWSGFEGTAVFEKGRVHGPTVPPIFEMPHSAGVCSVTGGVVYRGSAIAGLRGAYLFADLCRNGIHGLVATTPADGIGAVTDERVLAGAEDASQIISFATDADGEVYVLSAGGAISRIDPSS